MRASLVLVLFLAAGLACDSSRSTGAQAAPKVSPEDAAKVAELAAAAAKEADARDAQRKAGLAAAAAGELKLGGACPVSVALRDPREPAPAGFDAERMKREVDALARVELTFLKKADLARHPAPLVRYFTTELAAARKLPLAAAQQKLAEIQSPEFWDYDVVIVEDERVDPTKQGEQTFAGGHLRGQALLWSYKDQKVLCAAKIDVGSSEKVKVRETTTASGKTTDNAPTALGVDLMQNAIREGIKHLSAVE